MKKIAILTILMGLVQSLHAVEYFTLTSSAKTVSVSSGSLVEVVGFANWVNHENSEAKALVEFTFANGDISIGPLIAGIVWNAGPSQVPILNQKFTNVTQVRIYRSDNAANLQGGAVTLKVTPAAEIDSAGPKTVLVIPENSTGDYDVVIESSGDMTTWTPMHSQTVTGSGPQHFFRTRIVKR